MTTKRLYDNDPYLKSFEAQIIHTAPTNDGRWSVLLDQTAFFPEGGGQPADHGLIRDAQVVDVWEQGDDVIHITTKNPGLGPVIGAIDWERRFDHMQQHSGEHLLSAAFYQLYKANNIGFHFGPQSCQIDFDQSDITIEKIVQAELLVNRIIYENRPSHCHTVVPHELTQYRLRRPPAKNFDQIRLVEFDHFDYCPCCGTHVASTGEIGIVKVCDYERKKHGTRINFVCGKRALHDYQSINHIIHELMERLSSPADKIITAYDQQCAKEQLLRQNFAKMQNKYFGLLADDLFQHPVSMNGIAIITHVLYDILPQEILDLAKQMTGRQPSIVLLAGVHPDQSKAHLLFTCTANIPVHMGQLLKETLPLLNGKGGGSAQLAQGGIDNTANLETVLQQIQQQLITKINK